MDADGLYDFVCVMIRLFDCFIILDDALYIILILNCWLLTTSYKATGDIPEYTYIEEIMEPDTKIFPQKKC